MPRKPDQIKYCAWCGKQLARKRMPSGVLESSLAFGRRKYCDRKCMAQAFDAKVSTSDAWSVTHQHARKLVPAGPCNRCGKPRARDVHHRDHDHRNNDPANLERLCRSCHNREHQSRQPCTVCGLPQKGHGYCNKHYIRWKKYGDPLATRIPPRTSCSSCGAPAHSRGLCGKHYMVAKRAGTLPPLR